MIEFKIDPRSLVKAPMSSTSVVVPENMSSKVVALPLRTYKSSLSVIDAPKISDLPDPSSDSPREITNILTNLSYPFKVMEIILRPSAGAQGFLWAYQTCRRKHR